MHTKFIILNILLVSDILTNFDQKNCDFSVFHIWLFIKRKLSISLDIFPLATFPFLVK